MEKGLYRIVAGGIIAFVALFGRAGPAGGGMRSTFRAGPSPASLTRGLGGAGHACATLWHLISRGSRGTPRIAAFMLAVVFATGAVTAVFHMGGEMKWWDLPATCSGGGDINLESLAALALGTGPVESVVMCDAVTWRFLGLSMAGWHALISVALAVFSLLAAKRPKDARAPRN